MISSGIWMMGRVRIVTCLCIPQTPTHCPLLTVSKEMNQRTLWESSDENLYENLSSLDFCQGVPPEFLRSFFCCLPWSHISDIFLPAKMRPDIFGLIYIYPHKYLLIFAFSKYLKKYYVIIKDTSNEFEITDFNTCRTFYSLLISYEPLSAFSQSQLTIWWLNWLIFQHI